MQSTKKVTERVRSKKLTQDDLPRSAQQDEKVKKGVYSISTPRNFVQKSSAADIYTKKKSTQAPKKIAVTPRINDSPMKGLIKSSPSTSSIMSTKTSRSNVTDSKRNQFKSLNPSTPKKFALTNVTVNSPIAKRKLNLDLDKETPRKTLSDKKEPIKSNKAVDPLPGRQRTKTRTLEDDEVKILTPDAIDNNAAMQELSRKLSAKPKAFYVDLEDAANKPSKKIAVKKKEKSSEEDEVSYEDDFESYESDFDSYHSENNSDVSSTLTEESGEQDDEQFHRNVDDDVSSKDVKDEEKMMDSGNFELNESQRSATRKREVMDFILEGSEDAIDDKKVSLDEGFQEMSSSSTVSSMRIVHTDILDRPLFIDFTKSKANKRKRKIFERLKQRANDILSMVTLHEMSYSLFEMKPIPYDLYMATFGRKNYTQTGVQTFEDGVSQEIQTEYISCDNKWTQFPIEFSNHVVCHDEKVNQRENKVESFIEKFNFLLNDDIHHKNNTENEEYKTNPLKIYLEQKDGAGGAAMLPEETYKSKLKNTGYNANKLKKFLKKFESKISRILSLNVGSSDILNLLQKSKLPFSNGYINISYKNITVEKFNFLKYTRTIGVTVSETKDNIIVTYHSNSSNSTTVMKCVICLWDTSIANCDPIKVLKATDNVAIGRYRGSNNGIFVAALEDGTIHLWDLSEDATWYNDDGSIEEKDTELVEVDQTRMSEIEKDREWNLRNSHVTTKFMVDLRQQCTMQVSSYTSSAVNMQSKDSLDTIVGLEFVGDIRGAGQEGGRKILGQICTLQRLGMLTIWSIAQEKSTTNDIGKAYWSRIKLEKNQTLYLPEYLDVPINDSCNSFNLNAAKRRLSNRKQERVERKKNISRPKSAMLKNFDRPSSAASPRKNLPTSPNIIEWESGIVCNHLKILRLNKTDNYLIANNNGEVLCCRKNLRDFKVDRLCVATDRSVVTKLEVTHENLPYFLAATDSGTVNLCTILEARVLLSLDCRNAPPLTGDRCHADSKGRFVASVPAQSTNNGNLSYSQNSKFIIKSIAWLPTNPFCITALLASGAMVTWQLTRSDMHAESVLENAAVECASSRCSSMALITSDGDVQIHRISDGQNDKNNLELFKKYVALL